jgi:UTP-glucose-1-phosphate uridylyltransferase
VRSTIRKAVIPAAGIGSRLLPLTKAIPKEMLPVGDKPVIEHTVRELVNSGITDITIVVSGGKSLIQEHFRPSPVLVERLRADGKDAYADAIEDVAELSHRGHITYLDQHGPYGNGTPVLNAARSFGDEPILVLWPDDVFVAEVPRAQQLIRAYERTSSPVLALMPMAREHSRRYGVPIVKEDLDDGLLRIVGLVRNPNPRTPLPSSPPSAATSSHLALSTSCANKPSAGMNTGPARSTSPTRSVPTQRAARSTARSSRETGTTPETRPTTSSPSSLSRWRTPPMGRCCASWPVRSRHPARRDYAYASVLIVGSGSAYASAKFRVTDGSTGMPGPVVVETVTFFR